MTSLSDFLDEWEDWFTMVQAVGKVEDIPGYEQKFKALNGDVRSLHQWLSCAVPDEEYRIAWGYLLDVVDEMETAFEYLEEWDTDSDGYYSLHEINVAVYTPMDVLSTDSAQLLKDELRRIKTETEKSPVPTVSPATVPEEIPQEAEEKQGGGIGYLIVTFALAAGAGFTFAKGKRGNDSEVTHDDP